MANPNPFRQVPPEDDIPRPGGSQSFFGDPKFDVTRSKIDLKEPLITSLPRTFSRFTRRKTTLVDKSLIRRRQSVATNRKAISILTMLLVVLGGFWGTLEFSKKPERPSRRVTRQEKKLNLKRAEKTVSAAKVALRALTLPTLGNTNEAEPAKAEAKPDEKPVEATPKTFFVTSPLLRIRSKPGLDGSIVRVLKAGDAVEVVGEDGSWAKLGDGEYVGKRHLAVARPMLADQQKPADEKKPAKASLEKRTVEAAKVEKPVSKAPLAPTPVSKLIAAQSVKIRGAPGPKQQVVGILRKGTTVSVYEVRGVWARIGENQYVHKGNLRPEGATPPPSPTSR